ncbi:hypothetical protein Clacol_001997 [Clathrus columnatus]|uniref:Uncharacterized protein n=1 Tax=Clathrus columnatus TaxID=1419009 RepID=A0AAV5A2F1_9AGAM|nr:hypothetical protein Clacol_001997 [Clathrus columnatus]
MSSLPSLKEIPYVPRLSGSSSCLLDYNVREIVDVALYTLKQNGLQPIEWGALLEHRRNVPLVIRNYSYIVDGEKIESASELLTVIGLPLMPSTGFDLRVAGEFRAKGRFHRITHSILPPLIHHLVLYPQSFIPLLPDELEDVPSIHMMSPRLSPRILAPKPAATYAAHVRMLLAYPYASSTWTNIMSSLSSLIAYGLLEMKDGCCPNIEDEDEYWEVRYPELAAKALATLREWTCEGKWADGEDWICDVLAAFINQTGDLRHLALSNRC